MKTRLWIIIGIIIFVAVYLPIHYYYPFLGIGTTHRTYLFCEEGFIQSGNKCVPHSIITEENNCGQFYTAPKIQYNSNTVPVLLMDSNSTGCARLTFTIYDNHPDAPWSKIANFTSSLFIGNSNYTSHGIIFSVSPGKDYTNSFQIIVTPEIVDLTNFQQAQNFTVTYIIKPLSNSTGFYDHSISMLPCSSYPIAVGNTADQLSYSDFSYIYPTPHSCMAMPYILTAVEISGIRYDYITLPVERPNN
jgi:hypothetical protein